MINSKINIKALMKLIEDECKKGGFTFRTSLWGSCSWESGMVELNKDGVFQERDPMKFRRSTSGMTIKITFYDSDKPKELDEQPKNIMRLLRDCFDDALDDE